MKYGEIKFCEIRANMCIEGYPEKNTPTILVYKDGDIRRQVITLKELGGVNTSIRGKLEAVLKWFLQLLLTYDQSSRRF